MTTKLMINQILGLFLFDMIDISDIIPEAYLVGGSVRDALLDKIPKDFDYCTPMLPNDIESAIKASGRRTFTIGKRFGTIGFKYDNEFVEVTTFRSEKYVGTRKPEVKFVSSLTEDLSRRDFTINAMAKRGNKIIDPFGGKNDIEHGIIRCVGNPTLRFKEDPLRMLRAIRFSSQLNFTIETRTFASIKKNAHSILSVSKERWGQELDKMLLGDNIEYAIYALVETGLIKFVLPELRLQHGYDQNSDYHELSLLDHSIQTASLVPADITLRWAALLHDIGKPFVRTDNIRGSSNYVFHDVVGAELIYGIGKRLKWANERIETVSDLIKNHLSDESPLRKADNASKTDSKQNI